MMAYPIYIYAPAQTPPDITISQVFSNSICSGYFADDRPDYQIPDKIRKTYGRTECAFQSHSQDIHIAPVYDIMSVTYHLYEA